MTTGTVSVGEFSPTGTLNSAVEILSTPAPTLGQVVSIPVSMTKPTLSFVGDWSTFGTVEGLIPAPLFVVKISDGITKTTVYTVSRTLAGPIYGTPLTFNWVDMHPWVGKTVTLTFEVTATQGSLAFGSGRLDKVSLSSWITPVPKQLTISNTLNILSIASGSVVSLTLTGENFIAPVKLRLNTILLPDAKWVDGNTITATLPANLPFGRYDVFVTNADGPENALYGALVIGTETFAPVLMR